MMNKVTMKKLCRIRLINWHYFDNETINVKGSFLISGENTSGKSTVLDAIQLVLTTNTRKFNTAANEKSKRDLKGYVRCKTGNEDSTYVRTGSIITYVALEFFEERTSKYFTIGVKIDSPDEESKLIVKWFREECRLEDLKFVTGSRPSTNEDFRKNDKKVQLISQVSEAKLRFGQRLGNLEDRFFDMIPKSLAFKPMDNVKDFINKFILPERTIEVATLRNNIAVLKELEDLMDVTKVKIEELNSILLKNDEIIFKEREIKINEILIKRAEVETKKIELQNIIKENEKREQNLIVEKNHNETLKISLENERKRFNDLQLAINQNEITRLLSETKHRIELLKEKSLNYQKAVNRIDNMIQIVSDTLSLLNKNEIFIIKKEELYKLSDPDFAVDDKTNIIYKLKKDFNNLFEKYNLEYAITNDLINKYKDKKSDLEKDIKNLENKKLTYPENTNKLKEAIEKEFLKTGIKSETRIFSDLLEVTDDKWQNAIEGYLNTQRFYIIVEPQYYKVALEVYNRIKNEVHTVGLVNTEKLDIYAQADNNSLAYIIKCDNRYAKAYAIYLLNKVIRCDDVQNLKDYKIAITKDCMIYQNYAVRKIDSNVYRTPFIGANAYKIQLENKKIELEQLKDVLRAEDSKLKTYKIIKDKISICNIEVLRENMNAPLKLKNNDDLISKEKVELKKAEADPSYIEIQLQIEECRKIVDEKDKEFSKSINKIGQIEYGFETNKNIISIKKREIDDLETGFANICEKNTEESLIGINKFNDQVKTKSPSTIVQNFSPLKVGLENKKNEYNTQLIQIQIKYCSKYQCDLGSGHEEIREYINEHHKLVSADIIKYEEDLKKAKENCEHEFRESFLARLKENIDNAIQEFKNLNYALRDIYYGDDSYKFEITYDNKKENIYKMIMSKNNLDNFEGYNLFSDSFYVEFKEEMDDLFAKLTAYDDKGEKVLAEYTDYRSYLDYDIIVQKNDGTQQRFSKIYGEKSGGETQTPYYVAIAASFVQLYKLGDTIRVIMLDEAFDKMDDNRISSMMDFLNSQNFQIILATPPSKIEVIGEKVDTILMAMRNGTSSIIEEYDL